MLQAALPACTVQLWTLNRAPLSSSHLAARWVALKKWRTFVTILLIRNGIAYVQLKTRTEMPCYVFRPRIAGCNTTAFAHLELSLPFLGKKKVYFFASIPAVLSVLFYMLPPNVIFYLCQERGFDKFSIQCSFGKANFSYQFWVENETIFQQNELHHFWTDLLWEEELQNFISLHDPPSKKPGNETFKQQQQQKYMYECLSPSVCFRNKK